VVSPKLLARCFQIPRAGRGHIWSRGVFLASRSASSTAPGPISRPSRPGSEMSLFNSTGSSRLLRSPASTTDGAGPNTSGGHVVPLLRTDDTPSRRAGCLRCRGRRRGSRRRGPVLGVVVTVELGGVIVADGELVAAEVVGEALSYPVETRAAVNAMPRAARAESMF
jgi:hypothetical protein